MKRRNTVRTRDKPKTSRKEIGDYCSYYCIRPASSYRSFYFWHNGRKYRVSDHPPSIFRLDDNAYLIQVECPMNDLIDIHQAVINGYPIDHQGRVRHSA